MAIATDTGQGLGRTRQDHSLSYWTKGWGKDTEEALERAYITCNKNGVPFDPAPPAITSGIRVGSPAATTRGFGVAEFEQVGRWIVEIVDAVAAGGDSSTVEARVRGEVIAMTDRFPIYAGPIAGQPL